MKRSWLNLESPMQKQKRRQRQADELVELVWEKDEIVMRRPLPFPTTTTAQVVKRPKYLLSTSSTPSPPHHRNDLPFGLFPDHQLMYHHRLIQSVDHNTFNDDVSKNKKISPIKTPSPLPVPGDSRIVPDNDHEQHESAAHHIIHNSQVLGGNYFTSGDDYDEKNPTTTKQRQVETPIPIVRPFAHHDRVKVNSRQASDVQINENNCELKTSTNNSTRGAAGLLNFVTTTNFSSSSTSRSAHHQLLDGRPAVVASTAMNSTPLLPKTKPKPKISTSTTAVKPPPNLDYDNPIAVLVPDYDIDDHHRSQADPSFASKSKQNHSSAPNYTYSGATAMRKQVTDNKSYACCDEALVPSFSVCSNDPNTATHDEDDSEPCPCINKLSIEDEPQLRPPPSTSNKTPLKAATRKGPATALHNLSERRRRDKINKKMRALQALIPNCNKVKKASILDDAITYMKTLQLQLQMMSMGTAAGVMPPNPMMLAGNGAPPHLRTSFALPPPPPTFQMLGFAPTAAAASFVPVNLAPSLPLVPPSISLSLSSSKNSNPPHLKHDHRSKSNPNFLG